MTQIFFYHGAHDRLQAAATWLLQSWERRQPVLVYAPLPADAEQLDRLLWLHPPTGFIPHCRADSPLAAETPIVIARQLEAVSPLSQDECLLNLSDEMPPGFARFKQLIEIVSAEDAVRLPARERFKFYRERGYDIQSEDLAKRKS